MKIETLKKHLWDGCFEFEACEGSFRILRKEKINLRMSLHGDLP